MMTASPHRMTMALVTPPPSVKLEVEKPAVPVLVALEFVVPVS